MSAEISSIIAHRFPGRNLSPKALELLARHQKPNACPTDSGSVGQRGAVDRGLRTARIDTGLHLTWLENRLMGSGTPLDAVTIHFPITPPIFLLDEEVDLEGLNELRRNFNFFRCEGLEGALKPTAYNLLTFIGDSKALPTTPGTFNAEMPLGALGANNFFVAPPRVTKVTFSSYDGKISDVPVSPEWLSLAGAVSRVLGPTIKTIRKHCRQNDPSLGYPTFEAFQKRLKADLAKTNDPTWPT